MKLAHTAIPIPDALLFVRPDLPTDAVAVSYGAADVAVPAPTLTLHLPLRSARSFAQALLLAADALLDRDEGGAHDGSA